MDRLWWPRCALFDCGSAVVDMAVVDMAKGVQPICCGPQLPLIDTCVDEAAQVKPQHMQPCMCIAIRDVSCHDLYTPTQQVSSACGAPLKADMGIGP
jgi:hypothetical protein